MFKPEDGRRKTEDGGRLDVAINRAVRELLDVEPPAGLRGRVLQRIEGADPRSLVASGSGRKILWTALPVAVALILAVFAPWRSSAPAPVPAAAPQVASIERRSVVPPLPAAGPAPQPSAREESRRPATRRLSGPARSLDSERIVTAASYAAAPGGVDIAPLAAIEPIRVAAVSPAAIEHRGVVVTPLAPIAQLQIAPLTTPDGRF